MGVGRVYCASGELNPPIWIARNLERRAPRGAANKRLFHAGRDLSYLVAAHERTFPWTYAECQPWRSNCTPIRDASVVSWCFIFARFTSLSALQAPCAAGPGRQCAAPATPRIGAAVSLPVP